MRRFRSISDYLSLGAGPSKVRASLYGPYMGPVGGTPTRLGEDTFVTPRITVALLRDTVAKLVAEGVPPISNVRYPIGYVDTDGTPCIVKRGGDIPEGHEVLWHEPRPGSETFGPYYEASLPPAEMTALLGDPEFGAAETSGEFRVAGKGIIILRPPAEETRP